MGIVAILEHIFYSNTTINQIKEKDLATDPRDGTLLRHGRHKPTGSLTYSSLQQTGAMGKHPKQSTKKDIPILGPNKNLYHVLMDYIPDCEFGYNYMMKLGGSGVSDLEDIIVSIRTKLSGKERHIWYNVAGAFYVYIIFELNEDYTLFDLTYSYSDKVKVIKIFKDNP